MRTFVMIAISICLATVLPAAAQSNPLYVASPDTNTVLVIDPDSETVIAVIEVGPTPTAVTIDPDTGHVMVTNSGDDTISVIDSDTNEVIDTIERPATANNALGEAQNSLMDTIRANPRNPMSQNSDHQPAVAPENRTRMSNARLWPFVQLVLPSYPLCPLNPDADRATFQTNLTPGLIDLQCRVLAENGEFVKPPAEIGVQTVLDLGVIHAVELFSPSGANMERIDVCLRGIGNIIFLDAAGRPREPELLQRTVRSGYTCAQLPGPGTIILVA